MKGEQLNLFGSDENNLKKRRPSVQIPVDILILLSIVVVLSLILVYSLGIEKGRLASLPKEKLYKTELAYAELATPEITEPVKKEIIEPASAPLAKTTLVITGYIVQLASYNQEKIALSEINRLNKKGYLAKTVKKGQYWILYVGAFDKKSKAKQLMTKLKSQYRDCFIRRL